MFIDDENEISNEDIDTSNNPFEKKEEDETNNEKESDNSTCENDNNEAQEEDACEKLKAELEDLNNKYLRLAADFDNFRKRTIQEKDELSKFATIEVLRKLTSVLDTFDRAQEQLKDIEECQMVKDSYNIVYKQLLDTLKKCGMEEIEALGNEFNPNEHEAITQVPTDEVEPDKIAFVAQKGYKMGDKVIRPALVGVAKKKEDE